MNDVRLKMICSNTVHRVRENSHYYKLIPIYHNDIDSHEDKKTFGCTPFGSLEITTPTNLNFEAGKEYYIDISPAN